MDGDNAKNFKVEPAGHATSESSVLCSVPHRSGALSDVLLVFKEHGVNLNHIESRPNNDTSSYDIRMDFQGSVADPAIVKLFAALKAAGCTLQVMSMDGANSGKASVTQWEWFPRRIADLDQFVDRCLDGGSDLEADHPGFHDPVYRARREEITEIARTYRHGDVIPQVKYTADETATWGNVYSKVLELVPTHACKQYHYIFPLLEQNCGYAVDNIPQINDISRFLHDCTGFTLRPVQGLLSSRDFLNGLAFRVFHSTQYIRHHTKPLYTPEPDLCHELIGHVPLFADADFAEFSHQIGLASLGVSDEDVKRLATCYWFTVEFGLCKEEGNLRAYGAGLLSSFGELKYCLGGDPDRKPEYKPFDPVVTAEQEYPITDYQPVYFVADSFRSATEKMRTFGASLARPCSLHYNPYTQTIQVLDSKDKLLNVVKGIQGEVNTLIDGLQRIGQKVTMEQA